MQKSHMNFSFHFIEDSLLRLQVFILQQLMFDFALFLFYIFNQNIGIFLYAAHTLYPKTKLMYENIFIYNNHFPYLLFYTRLRCKQRTLNMLPEYQWKNLFNLVDLFLYLNIQPSYNPSYVANNLLYFCIMSPHSLTLSLSLSLFLTFVVLQWK